MKNRLFFNGNNLLAKVVFATMMLMMATSPVLSTAHGVPAKSNDMAELNMLMITGMPSADAVYLISGPAAENEIYTHAWTDDPKCTDLPTVTTLAATSVTSTYATLNGIVNPNSGPTNYYFQWGTTTNYGNATASKYAGSGSSNVNVSSYISELSPNTTYHLRLVATNLLGTSFGNDIVFVTGSITLTTGSAIAITSTTAISSGNITSNGGAAVTERGVCWNTSLDPTTSDPHTINGTGNGAFTSSITGLIPGTFYYVRAYATNANGTSYGSNKTFTTLSCENYTIPFLEGFSSVTLPDCWTQTDHQGNGQLWQFGTISTQSPSPVLSGNYAYLNSNDFGSGDLQNADLISPVMNFSANTSINLLFNHFILCNNGSSGTLSYSLNLGSDWTVIQAFATTSPSNPEAYSTVIPALAGQPQVMFKWNYTGTYGSYWAIDDVQVLGTQPPPTLSVTPANRDVLPPAGSTSFTVSSNTDWTAVSDQTWCSVTPSGTGDGTITATYTENNTASQRVANITVTVTGLSPEVVTVTQAAPYLSVTPENHDVSYPGGNVVFDVTSNTIWSASSNQSWCTVPQAGFGNGTINAVYSENNLPTPRIAEITIIASGLPAILVTVSQAEGPPSLSVTPTNRNVTPGAGSTTFSVITSLSWSASSDQLWCTVTPSGVGNETLTATYQMNNTDLARVANISVTAEGIGPIVVTVTQATSTLTVNPANRNVSGNSGTTTFIVTSTVNWTASSNQPWCTVTPSGSGNGVITATFGENNTNDARVAQITVSATGIDPVVVTVTQLIYTGSSNFLLSARNLTQTSPNSLEFDVFLLCTETIQPFELASIQFGFLLNAGIYTGGVLTATYDNSGSGLSIIQQFTANPSIAATINGYPGLTLIRQAGKAPPGFGSGTIISATGDGTLITHYTITSSVPFTENTTANLTFTSSTSTNPLYATRVAAYINGVNTQLWVVSGENAIIPENPLLNGPPVLEVAPGSQTVDTTAGDYGFMVNSNTTWIAQTNQPWVTVTPSGFGDGTMIATYTKNTSETRTAVITVSAPGLEDTEVTISQEGSTIRTLNLNLMIEGLYAGNGTMNQAQNENGPHFGAGIADVVTLELHNSSDYAIVEHVASDVEVNMAGYAMINLPAALNGAYYVTIKHRNSIETTSIVPVLFSAQTVSYAFDLPDKVYGGNLQLMIDGQYVIKSGDINHDGSIDTGDMTLVDNAAAGYSVGYIPADVNGDGTVDTADMTIVDNNSAAYVTAETP